MDVPITGFRKGRSTWPEGLSQDSSHMQENKVALLLQMSGVQHPKFKNLFFCWLG